MVTSSEAESPRVVGRYMLFDEIASGGMATVRFGRLIGEVGFSRTVAVKCLHAHFAKDQEFAKMFLDEARLAARIRHPNVVPILDVVAREGELFLVMDYVQGESLSKLVRATRQRKTRIPLRIVATIMAGVLDGLHAAHEAKSEQGEPLGIVHRDVSPQNVMVGMDGVARVLDFGVAKAAGRLQTTRDGQLKGKLAYMAPEQLKADFVDRRTDIYAASVVLWEALTGQRLFKADDELGIFGMVLEGRVKPPSSVIPSIPKEYDALAMRGLSLDPTQRFATAREMAVALERVSGVASPRDVGAWVEDLANETLRKRAKKIVELESISSSSIQSMMKSGNVPGGLTSPSILITPGLPPPRIPPPRHPSSSSISAVRPPPPVAFKPPGVVEDLADDALSSISDVSAVSQNLSAPSGLHSSIISDPSSSHSQLTSLSMAQGTLKKGPRPRILLAVIAITLVLSSLFVGVTVIFSGWIRTEGAGQGDAGGAGLGLAVPTEASVQVDQNPDAGEETERGSTVETEKNVQEQSEAGASVAPIETKKPPSVKTARPVPTPTATRTATAPPEPTTPPKPPTPTKSDCNPPYSIDDRGVRVPKPHCL